MQNYLRILLVSFVTVSAQETLYECLSEEESQLTLDNCQEGEVVHIEEILYGKNVYCRVITGDCRELDLQTPSQCLCERSCVLTARQFYSIKCASLVNFVRVVYSCRNINRTDCAVTTSKAPSVGKPVTTMSAAPPTFKTSNEDTPGTRDIINKWRGESLTSRPTSPESEEAKQLLIIVACAASAAVLVMAIITVVVLLRRFSWTDEKYCLVGIFVPTCLRRTPQNRNPDGSEHPDEDSNSTGTKPLKSIMKTRKTKLDIETGSPDIPPVQHLKKDSASEHSESTSVTTKAETYPNIKRQCAEAEVCDSAFCQSDFSKQEDECDVNDENTLQRTVGSHVTETLESPQNTQVADDIPDSPQEKNAEDFYKIHIEDGVGVSSL